MTHHAYVRGTARYGLSAEDLRAVEWAVSLGYATPLAQTYALHSGRRAVLVEGASGQIPVVVDRGHIVTILPADCQPLCTRIAVTRRPAA
jgi:hypothetical protein